MESRRRWWRGLLIIVVSITAASITYIVLSSPSSRSAWFSKSKHHPWEIRQEGTRGDNGKDIVITATLPAPLMNKVYSESDFINVKGIVPSFWQKQDDNSTFFTWGPCFPPKTKVNWNETIQRWYHANDTDYHAPPKKTFHQNEVKEDLSDYCRPGFIIIGAGKCGTSSLYHYLTGHPRVLPAVQKQIHYFKYYYNYPMKWYLAHFSTATSFLSAGALMTGEASPGYLPYPDVAARTARQMGGAKIIAVGREPLDRAYSSYRYNYVTPAIIKLKSGGVHGIDKGQSEDYYKQYVFSFEEMMRAELAVLKECLAPGGPGDVGAKKMWGAKSWAVDEYKRRKDNGLPPLIDLDANCYGNKVSNAVPRKQWTDLVAAHPEKVINVDNMFLVQALLGRSLYVFPLEWWYNSFSSDDIYFICTEEMKDLTGEPLNQLGQFLGLPSYNFSSVVGEGMFNVGGHKGYDKEIPWDQVEEEIEGKSSGHDTLDIPLSEEFRKELSEFIRPYNERLFELVGRRCNW